ncbi:phosphoenolpyruvate carboxykinase (ATP) [Chishuiella changwenlii]|jgi:phosphoenolpyruvate carboxykinase (ATP)|uniref:Phosphoenolpyruvate carboxykinase (ATP) n=1 Tax=Chishuiella changwenlii TaxID=1434701 RepID=A0A1M7A723_9FLAO|nr:phosphoenolpyruvate carboxykinase (ATP) [Chishuiella changwenlii]GGF10132.1 phosphoenolpyruvate carboxykinase (ATP) [Chishuiella changwenlii]SHL38507.1 phosphoenolpyruvate carboxykinase (ATP) [Chishuiella changwenlii]
MSIELASYGIKNSKINYQLSSKELTEKMIETGQGEVSSSGAVNFLTGEFTGRSPKDRFIVKDDITSDNVWWDGNINIPFDSDKFDALYDKVVEHLSNREVYVRDAFACADDAYKVKIRAITETPGANLFIYNMFIRPTEEELKNFGDAEWTIINAPTFLAEANTDGTRQHNFSILNFKRKIVLNGGTGYTGEMKKGIFSALNFIMPVFKNTLPMHCSANSGKDGDTAMFFGLSGTGKTTLSADKNRQLIGDDEHGWTEDNTVFNFEGGCYAKVINLSAEGEPEIFGAIKDGALLENCKLVKETNDVDYTDGSITENTRVSYPIDYIENIATPSLGKNPKNIFFLSFDAYGVFPPIAKLNPDQAAYLFISGYTSKVAGTEAGVTEPQTTFSSCFGAPFMPLHPTKYAEMLSNKVEATGINVWLINTGWNGQKKRMSLKDTRAVINAALNGDLDNIEYRQDQYFGFEVPVSINGVEADKLNPATSFESQEAYEANAQILADKFKENFKKFEEFATADLLAGGPRI